MPRRDPLPNAVTSSPFSVDTALELGVTLDRLRSRDLVTPFHGVRSTVPVLTLLERCGAYATRMHPEHAFSHTTAALLWGMPMPSHSDTTSLHVTAFAPGRAPAGVGIVGHSLTVRATDIVTLGGLRIISPASTCAQLSTLLAVHDLVAAAEFAITGNPYKSILPLMTLDELRTAFAEGQSRGRRARELALPAIREGALSRPESILRYFLEWVGLTVPWVNVSVHDSRGSFVAQPDLAWPESRFAIEYEGDHHRDVDQYRKDILRLERLIDLGWSVMRVSADDLFRTPDATVARVMRRLTDLGADVSSIELRRIGQIRP